MTIDSKDKFFENIEKSAAKSKKIQTYYSTPEAFEVLVNNYNKIIFTSYMLNKWSVKNKNKINDFLDIYCIKCKKKDKLTFFYHIFRNYLDFFSLVGNKKIIAKYTVKDFFESKLYLELDERHIKDISDIKNTILDKIFDEAYKEIKVKKKNGEPHLLEGSLEFIGDEKKQVELKNIESFGFFHITIKLSRTFS